jgi:hypothetical protein
VTIYVVWADCGKYDGYSWTVKGFTDKDKALQFAADAFAYLKDNNMLNPNWEEGDDTDYFRIRKEWTAKYKERQTILSNSPYDPKHAGDLSRCDGIEYSVKEVEVME